MAAGIVYKDTELDLSFQFVLRADYGPFAARRQPYLEVGGIDESFGNRGECEFQPRAGL